MKVIAENLITGVLASSEESADYADENLLDEYPGHIWKGDTASETLTVSISGLCSGFAIFNTNADSILAQISDPNLIQWEVAVLSSGDDGVEWEAGTEWSSFIVPTETIAAQDDETGAFMIQWDQVSADLEIIVSLANSAGSAVFAGTIVAGLILSFAGPHGEIMEGTKDLSFVDEYNSGAVFVKDRDVLRTFDNRHIITRDAAFNNFIFLVKKIIKKRPAAWLITDLNNSRWLVYARFTVDPKGRHSPELNGYTELTYQLTEVR